MILYGLIGQSLWTWSSWNKVCKRCMKAVGAVAIFASCAQVALSVLHQLLWSASPEVRTQSLTG